MRNALMVFSRAGSPMDAGGVRTGSIVRRRPLRMGNGPTMCVEVVDDVHYVWPTKLVLAPRRPRPC